jgi:hypothetical protein
MMTRQDAVRLAEIRARSKANYPGEDAVEFVFLIRLIDEAYTEIEIAKTRQSARSAFDV